MTRPGAGDRARARRPRRPVAIAPEGPARDLAIDAIAGGGDGIGRDAGLVVFVPRTAPGDLVRARWTSAGRFARATLVDVVRPSADRVVAPCPHYTHDRCGGCQLQHLAIGAQREAKRRFVADALARIGRRDVAVDAVVPSPSEWRYRRKLTLALRRIGEQWIAGLHPFDAPADVFALDDCPITDARVIDIWRSVLQASHLFPSGVQQLRGAVRWLESGDAAAATFTLEGGEHWPHVARFVDAVPTLAGVWWRPMHRERRRVDARGGAAAGASFAQVNAATAAALRADVIATLRTVRVRSFVDAYAGDGDVAVALATDGAQVTAIELDADASAVAAARLAPFGGSSVRARVEDALAAALPAEAVLVNPPRTGLDALVAVTLEQAAAGVFGGRIDTLLYVSCDPATLARDLVRLPSYRVTRVTPYDMFPQTAHVETLVVLTRVTHASEVSR